MKVIFKMIVWLFILLGLTSNIVQAKTFIHPGITHKKSDLDRIKYMVKAQIDPWYSSYLEMVADSKSSYDYTVQGDPSFVEVGRDNGVNYGAWKNDCRAAYYNAIRWYVEGDERYAKKAVEIFNAWKGIQNVTSNGTSSLSGGVGYIMIEAAEIIKSTYDGWSDEDIQAFKDMLVYPGYSNTAVPSGISTSYGSFYWQAYQGDAGRHGNQGLSGWRTVMAIGIFMDNEIMYDRALRYIKGLPHRDDDLPYPSGPNTSTSILDSTEYAITYKISKGSSIEDYGFNDVITNYIWETGQCQESSRDQQHVLFALGLLVSMSEMAWNQGEDLYSFADDRLLLGLEYSSKYNVSYLQSYDDQPEPWNPTVESGEFREEFDRTGRWYSQSINPAGIGDFAGKRPIFEMAVGHYLGRGIKTEDDAKWILRARDYAEENYGYEKAGWTNDAIGWGSLTARRPGSCYGDPITGFTEGVPNFNMHVIPDTIKCENFDYFVNNGNGKTYYDSDSGNKGNTYRTDEDVDIQASDEGGYHVAWVNPGEWLNYTVYVPENGTYDIFLRYSANGTGGAVNFSFGEKDRTGEVALTSTAGWQNWQSVAIAKGVLLAKGVQSMKLHVGGSAAVLNLNSIFIDTSSTFASALPINDVALQDGIKYKYYEGTWDKLPNFEKETILDSGVISQIKLDNGEIADGFGYQFDGYINIPTDGNYTFYTKSDDGSSLYIDGVLIVNNDGAHGSKEVSGSIGLQAGYHSIVVEYFDKSGGQSLDVYYESATMAKKEIDEYFYLPPDTATTSIEKRSMLLASNENLTVYPNPIVNQFTIAVPTSKNTVYKVFDLSSRVVMKGVINKTHFKIDATNLHYGVYLVRVNNKTKIIYKPKSE